MKSLKLEVGKTYLNRQGERVKIVGDNGHEMFPFEGDNCLSYTLDGHWDYGRDSAFDLVAEADAPPTFRTFKIPENTREISVSETDGRIVIEFVPEFKRGDVCINKSGAIYILKSAKDSDNHICYYWMSDKGKFLNGGYTAAGRLATPAEAQQLFDALAKDGKRWNPGTLRIEELTERDRIRAFLYQRGWEGASEDSIADIEAYIKHREAQLCK